MPRMRGRLYSSCASSTWSFPSADVACWAKMSRISCVRSMTRVSSAFSRNRCCAGSSSSSTSRLSASGVVEALLQPPRACPCRRRCAAPAAPDAGRPRRPARRPPSGRARGPRRARPPASTPWPSTARTKPRSGSGGRGIIGRKYGTGRPHPRSREHPVGIAQRGGALRLRPRRPCRSSRPYDDGESVLFAKRNGKPLVLLAGHTDTVPAQGNLPGPDRGRRGVGLGASDMKGGLAVMIELAALGARAANSRTTSGSSSSRARSSARPRTRCRACSSARRSSTRRSSSICLEPTDNTLQLGCLGNLNARVVFEGRAAHSARPWLGTNAIALALEGLAPGLDERAARRRDRRPRLPRGDVGDAARTPGSPRT